MSRFLVVIVMVFFMLSCTTNHNKLNTSSNTVIINNEELSVSGGEINSFVDVDINGCKEKVLIQSDDVEKNPILLFLHGGPGSSELLWAHIYENKLRKKFIFVNWDQRGTAFSLHEGMDTTMISEVQIHDDAIELIKYLMKKFNKKKIFLVGHSFGSVIGLQLAADYPDLFYAYIGVGQVIDSEYKRSVDITYKWLHETLLKANDVEAIRRVEKDKFPYIDLVVKYGGHHNNSISLDKIMMDSPYYYDGYFDLLKKGKLISQDNVAKHQKMGSIFHNSVLDIQIPLYFFEGVNDHVIACAPQIVVEYCQRVKSQKKEIIWFENSAHLLNVEEPEKFQDELIKIKARMASN
jgi:pimeloyl-ACP methyl ester carboxylesterase